MAEKKYIIDNPALMAEWDWEKNNEIGYAYKLKNAKIYSAPETLSKYNIRQAPQSFVYIEK